ncbi:MAG: ribosomal protein S2, flavodoxin-like domain-containing protein [Linnemannia gamsii]|nr:37S ribosomal protein, mitochondrial [Mortierella sp. AD032]KAK3845210.1 MAG: ribosomal protein S2, flavodoxin-like domain-containing protein [Linnemannia gamsii]
MAPSLLRSSFRVVQQAMASSPRVALRTTQSQMSRTWMRAGQAGMYSTGKGSGAGGEDDMLDAMMAGMESDFTVPTPTSSETTTSATSSEGSVDPEPTHVPTPVDLEKRLKALMPEYLSMGGQLAPKPKSALKSNPSSNSLTIAQLLAAGLHLGHSTSLWNVASMPFVFGVREGISIINLEHTLTHLRRACTVTKAVARQGGIILFIGTREGVDHVTIDAAKSCSAYYVASKWCPGTITNAQEIVGPHTPRLPDARAGDLAKPFRPDLVIVLNPLENMIAIKEATRFNIPTIAITDTDVDPRIVSYPIPANDDSVRGVELVAKVLAEAAKEGNVLAAEASKVQSKQRIEGRIHRMKEWSARA